MMSRYDSSVSKFCRLKAEKDEHFLLYLPEWMPQGYDLRPYLGGCGGVLYYPHCQSQDVEVGAEADDGMMVCEVGSGDDGAPNSVSGYIPNANYSSNDSKGYSNSSMEPPIRSTNYTKVQLLRPTIRTSR